ncbi:hypothetical protein Q5P01_000047 [Channa striata]|uniref:Uncharacterized protein n=1 Tax=Channa striata TaxID=64152 RepID=A0AA88IW89_CHASR|nr:hypothetical protein Q5P01_000047 [Channa striata]
MARTLAAQLHAGGTSRSLRGARERRPGAQKPSVRGIRSARATAPHVEFCKRHLGEIEYAAMKLLADVGMKEKLFLVTGAEWGHGESSPGSSAGLDGDLVSFHFRYLDCRELEEDRSLLVAPDPLAAVAGPEEFSDLDPSYCDGEIRRPRGLSGLFVSTFARAGGERLATLREACRGCGGSEADTLLVELANALEGAVTVCTGDSDLVAVLTASGREGLTLRLDNRSYREDRAMHDSPFGELLGRTRERFGSGLPPGDASSRDGRFRALCDVQLGDEGLLPRAQELHEDFERILEDHGGASFRSEAVDYLYRAASEAPSWPSWVDSLSPAAERPELRSLELQKPRGAAARATRSAHVFETLCDTGEAARETRRLEPPHREEEEKASGATRQRADAGRRCSANRENGSRSAWRAWLKLVRDERVRAERVLFMALCGTDYSVTPVGLGIKRLLTGAVANRDLFRRVCAPREIVVGAARRNARGGSRAARLSRHGRGARRLHWDTAEDPRQALDRCEMRIDVQDSEIRVRPLGAEEASDRPRVRLLRAAMTGGALPRREPGSPSFPTQPLTTPR